MAILKRFMWRIEMFQHTRKMKPILVWLYNHFHGNQNQIYMFLKKQQTVPDLQFIEEMANVDMKDYLVFTQVERFNRFCKKHNLDMFNTLVVKRKE